MGTAGSYNQLTTDTPKKAPHTTSRSLPAAGFERWLKAFIYCKLKRSPPCARPRASYFTFVFPLAQNGWRMWFIVELENVGDIFRFRLC